MKVGNRVGKIQRGLGIKMSKRIKTKYPGIYYRESLRLNGKGTEKIFYAVYKRDGKVIETKVGRQFADDMTPARAAGERAQLIEGKKLTRADQRKKDEAEANKKLWTIQALWEEYTSQKEETLNLKKDKNRYDQHLKKSFGKKLPGDIIPLDVDRLKRKLLKKYSPQTTKHVLALLKRVVNFGFKRGLSPALPFVIEMPEVNNIKDDALSDEQLQRLFKAIEENEHLHAGNFMLMALFTGMRRGELFKLKWSDIDFLQGFIHIRSPKGGKDQIIPLNDQARAVMESHIKTNSEFVFPGKGGRQRTNIQKPVNNIKKAAGLPKETRPIHSLRHTFATTALNSGIDLYTLQKLTTHKTAAMLQRYAHLSDERFKQGSSVAGDAMDKALKLTPKDNVVGFNK